MRTAAAVLLIELDGPGAGSAIFFRLHHGVADGVGGNAILAALTDAEPQDAAPAADQTVGAPGAWEERSLGSRIVEALGHRAEEGLGRARALAGGAWALATRPSAWRDGGRIVADVVSSIGEGVPSPTPEFGRSRHLTGFDLPFEPLRKARTQLGGQMIDVLLTATLGAVASWHRKHGFDATSEVMTLVPINLRPRTEQGIR